MSYVELAAAQGFACSCNTIPTKTSSGIKITSLASDSTEPSIHFYYIKDENDVFLYGDMEGIGANQWLSFGAMMDGFTFQGTITDISKANTPGYYAVDGGIRYYRCTQSEDVEITTLIKAGSYTFNDDLSRIVFPDDTAYSLNIDYVNNDIDYTGFTITPTFVDDTSGFIVLYTNYANSETKQVYSKTTMESEGLIEGWQDNIYKAIVVTTDTEVDDIYGTWFVSNTNYNEVNRHNEWVELITPSGNIALTEGGTYSITKYATATVNISSEERTVTPSESTQTVIPRTADYLSKVTVNPIPSSYIVPSGSITITENSTTDVTNLAEAIVKVQSVIEGNTLPTENIDKTKVYKYFDIIGTLVFDEIISSKPLANTIPITFTCNGVEYTSIYWDGNDQYSYKNSEGKVYVYPQANGTWVDDAYRTIIVKSYDESYWNFDNGANKALRAWLKACTVKQEPDLLYRYINDEWIGYVDSSKLPDSPIPAEIATEAEMTALLEIAEVGSVYKYTGTTGTYESGALYIVEEVSE